MAHFEFQISLLQISKLSYRRPVSFVSLTHSGLCLEILKNSIFQPFNLRSVRTSNFRTFNLPDSQAFNRSISGFSNSQTPTLQTFKLEPRGALWTPVSATDTVATSSNFQSRFLFQTFKLQTRTALSPFELQRFHTPSFSCFSTPQSRSKKIATSKNPLVTLPAAGAAGPGRSVDSSRPRVRLIKRRWLITTFSEPPVGNGC